MKTSSSYYKKIPIDDILGYPDAWLKHDLLSPQGNLLIPEKVPLRDVMSGLKDPKRIIGILENANIKHVVLTIKNEAPDEAAQEEIIKIDPGFRPVDPETAKRGMKTLDEVFALLLAKDPSAGQLLKPLVEELSYEIAYTNQIIFSLEPASTVEEYIKTHVFNMALLTGYLAKRLADMGELKSQKIASAIGAALLCDLGYLFIDPKIITKKDALTPQEYEEIKKHTQHSQRIAAEAGVTDTDVLDGIAYHHERWDGSGYSKGLAREDIPMIARIIAVADTFDAMTSNRVYKNAVSAKMAFNFIVNSNETAFDPSVCKAFITGIGIYPPGCIVQLSNGMIATVAASGTLSLVQPKVMIKDPGTKILDLSSPENRLYIVRAVDIESIVS